MDPVTFTLLTVLFVACVVVLTLVAPDPINLGRRLARRKQAEIDPWATWKDRKDELDKARAKEREDWEGDFNRIVRATCVHSYPATSQSPTYFTCWKCKYEEPWEYHGDCGCHYETVMSLTSPFPEYVPTYRYGNCVWHGVDWENYCKRSDRSNKPFKDYAELKARR